jgi:hypothetical protein
MRAARQLWLRSVAAGLLTALLLPTSALGQHKKRPNPDGLTRYDAQITAKDRSHWAFQPVRRPAVPEVNNRAWVRNPIDAFVLARLEAKGWKPSPPAEPQALLRRVYLDLLGLPPTPLEQEAFLNHQAADALERVMDRLLASPNHGERWARYWLDVVRYAETNGYERDADRPFVWRYRDYVIRSFSEDMPFDRFILEQLAGDELPDADANSLIATGYYRLGPWDDEPADPQEDRFDQLDDLVSTTGLAFLGLTMGCARCHDHKLEPLTMHDYYRVVAVFSGLKRPANGRTELTLPVGSRKELEARKGRKGPPDLPQGYVLHELSPQAPETRLLLRGKATRPGPRVEPGLPAVLVSKQPAFLPPDSHTSRRRLSLAGWIASPDNPLTARVIVNRVWQWHFGEGLVRSASDFGKAGDRPSHPELLDWLADWFVREGWSMHRLHRLILGSNTYRMSKRWRPDCGREDPDNRLLWRFPYRRLDAEAIRDSMLAISGRLNTKMYGLWTYPEVPKDALAGSSDPDKIWKAFDEREASRRTIYAHVKRSFLVPLLEVLDLCDTTRSSDRRLVTTVAPQALSLFNGSFANRQARHLAERLVKDVGSDPAKQIERAYRLALCRPPTATESSAMLRFLRQQASATEGGSRQALVQMCRVLLNLNELVYPD